MIRSRCLLCRLLTVLTVQEHASMIQNLYLEGEELLKVVISLMMCLGVSF